MTAVRTGRGSSADPRPHLEGESEDEERDGDDDEPLALAALPAPVGARVLALAADALGSLPVEAVPPELRQVARFTPSRRARLAARPLTRALESDARFREQIARRLRATLPEPAGSEPAEAADPADTAAAAYLLRPPGWRTVLEESGDRLGGQLAAAESAGQAREVRRLRGELERSRAAAREQLDRLRAELVRARDEADRLRGRLRADIGAARKTVAVATGESEQARRERDEAVQAAAAAEAEARRARARAAEAEAALDQARRARREGRDNDDVRLRMLLDTLLGAAQGLRRELALAPVESRPADAVAAAVQPAGPSESVPAAEARGLAAEDPAALARLLALPTVHLVVDGYNVTMSAYGEVPLQAQRHRLLAGLAGLAARTGAEVTCVFDGVGRVTPLALAAPRGVRLLFSPEGVTADEVIRQLVRHEPPGRPVVVVSSDGEVADSVRRTGARPVPSAALARLLERP